MPGSTGAPYNLPYPVGGDPVQDGDNQIKALAEKVATFLGAVGPTAIAAASGIASTVTAYKHAGMVTLLIAPITAPAGGIASGTAMTALLPAAFRPADNINVLIANTATSSSHALRIEPGGKITPAVATLAAGGVLYGSVTYPAATP